MRHSPCSFAILLAAVFATFASGPPARAGELESPLRPDKWDADKTVFGHPDAQAGDSRGECGLDKTDASGDHAACGRPIVRNAGPTVLSREGGRAIRGREADFDLFLLT